MRSCLFSAVQCGIYAPFMTSGTKEEEELFSLVNTTLSKIGANLRTVSHQFCKLAL